MLRCRKTELRLIKEITGKMNHILPFDEFEFVPLENADLTESTENAAVLPEEKVSSYEIKLLLDSDKTLGEDHRLKGKSGRLFT